MRIISTPNRKDNGFPIVCTMALIKDSEFKQPKDGLLIWQASGKVERIPKGVLDESVIFNVQAFSPLAKSLIAWPKGTALFIAGSLEKDDYWTNRKNHEVYKLRAEFVMAQKDYAAEMRRIVANDGDDGGEGVSSIEYDPGF